jgi:hypothetical protein
VPSPALTPYSQPIETASNALGFDWSRLLDGLLPLIGVIVGGLITFLITRHSEKKKAEYDREHKWHDEIQRLSVEMIESCFRLRRAVTTTTSLHGADDAVPSANAGGKPSREPENKQESVLALSSLHSALMVVASPVLYQAVDELMNASLKYANANNDDRPDAKEHHMAALVNFANRVRFVIGVDEKLTQKTAWVPDAKVARSE